MGRNTSIKATAVLVAAAMAFSLAAFSPSESLAANGKAPLWRGSIASLQLDDEGRPDWIQSGSWYVKISPASSAEGKPNVKFLAQMTMVQPDGTAAHKHRISNLVLSNYTANNSSLSVEGTATVTMRDGPVEDVPVKVSVTGRSVAIWVGPEMIDGHFGESPIYGMVSRVPGNMPAQSYSAPESPGPAPSASTANSTSTPNSTSTTSNNAAPAAKGNSTSATSSGNSTSTSSNSTSTSTGNQSSSGNNSTSNTSSNSTQSSNPPPATSTGSTAQQGTTSSISLAARPAMDLYSWFSGNDENPTLKVAANSDTTITITNETERKHKLIIQSQDGMQLAASQDILVGQSGQLVFKPTAAGTLQYMCDYHSPMKGTIEVS